MGGTNSGTPPKGGQFVKGTSGNPRGRPKGTRNLKTDLMEELNEPIAIRENGRTRKISKQRAMIKGTVAKAIQGDQRAFANVLTMAIKIMGEDLAKETQIASMSVEDKAIFDDFLRRQIERRGKS